MSKSMRPEEAFDRDWGVPKWSNLVAPGATQRHWETVDDMSDGEIDAYEYGFNEAMRGVTKILEGNDDGVGVANEPWESVRRRLIKIVEENGRGVLYNPPQAD